MRILIILLVAILVGCSAAPTQQPSSARAPRNDTAPVKYIGVYVLPYYQSADAPGGQPRVAVAQAFNAQLSSNKQGDILAVRDAIQARPQLITPMTLMVLAIRLYDVGLRDDAVFWFYVAKDRYFTLADVLNVKSPELLQVEDSVQNFAVLAGPFINSYAFCDIAKQQETSSRAIAWVEQHPYKILFMEQLPAMPGDRNANLKKSLESIKARADKEKRSLADPETLERFKKTRRDNHVNEQFCWSE